MDLKPVVTQFRADFRAMFAHWRQVGELSEGEAMQQYREAAQAVQEHMHDEGWMQAAAAHFRQLCIETEADKERSVRIASEVREAKWKEREADMKRRHSGKVPV